MRVSGSTGTAAILTLFVATTVVAGTGPVPTVPSSQADSEPDIQVRPVTLLFSEGAYGSDNETLTVRNVGNESLTVRALLLVGPDSESFEVAFDGPVTLAPGEFRNVTVTFDGSDSEPQFAMMHVLSDDPDEPQRNVWLTNTETVGDVSPSRVLAKKTLVNATVQDAAAGTRQSLNLSWPLTRDDGIAVDALSFVPERDGNVTLSVATNASRFGDVPTFALADGTEPAGFVHVEHSIDNTNVSNVSFQVRVRKDLLAGEETGPEDVALYRHEGGSWRELPTRLVEEGETHYFFAASAPGLSDFATGVKQAEFRITDAVVTVTRIRTGADGTYDVELLLDEEVVDRRELSIAPNGTRQATFDQSFTDPGTYQIFVNDRFVGNVTVNSGASVANESASGTDAGDGDTSTDVALPGFDPGTTVVALALVIGVLLLSARVRR